MVFFPWAPRTFFTRCSFDTLSNLLTGNHIRYDTIRFRHLIADDTTKLRNLPHRSIVLNSLIKDYLFEDISSHNIHSCISEQASRYFRY